MRNAAASLPQRIGFLIGGLTPRMRRTAFRQSCGFYLVSVGSTSIVVTDKTGKHLLFQALFSSLFFAVVAVILPLPP
jgi:hypothetical protein